MTDPRSGADEARHSCGGLGDLVVRSRAALTDGVGHARIQVRVEQLERDGLEGLRRGRDLGEHIDAVGVLVAHALHAPPLALAPPQPAAYVFLLLAVARHPTSRPRSRFPTP